MRRRSLVALIALAVGVSAFSTSTFGMQGRGRGGGGASIRLEVTPRETEVYVDGFPQGVVDQYDGLFQRLTIAPGQHELVLYLDGYRTVWQNISVAPRSDQKIKYAMVPLAAGEVAEPRPTGMGRGRGRSGMAPARGPVEAPERGTPLRPVPGESRYGAVSIRVQPAGADVFIDGERWPVPEGPDEHDRLVVQLSEGRHKIEVRKAGYQTFSVEVDVKRGETAAVNVSLSRGVEH